MSDPLAWLDDELHGLEADGLLRRLCRRIGPQGATIRIAAGEPSLGAAAAEDGELGNRRTALPELLNFGSNDYLSLAADPRLAAAADAAARREGWGAGASPLVTGHSAAHRLLERKLAEFFNADAALVFPSGFAANNGTIGALVGRGDIVLADENNHASLIDGCRLARAEVQVYPHCDMKALTALLGQTAGFRRRLIVSDSLFSMDGDLAPLGDLVELAERHDAMLMLDEAHAVGVFGRNGRGAAEQFGVEAKIPIRVGTLSKALGGAGGFVVGSRPLVEWLLNRARPYVFSTAHPPAVAAAAVAALEIVSAEPHRRAELLARAAEFRQMLAEKGFAIGNAAGQIVPLTIGDPLATVAWAAELRSRGFFVPAIRPPSVPPGQSLLRISLSYGHTPEMLKRLLQSLADVNSSLA